MGNVLPLLVFFLVPLISSPVFAEIEVNTCGQVVPEGETGLLTADLECVDVGEAVLLSDGAHLELNGHTITTDPASDERVKRGVRCLAGTVCSVPGPGLIGGFESSGIAGTRVRVREVVIESNGRTGIAAYEDVRVVDSVVVGNGRLGVHAGGTVRANRSHIGEHPLEAVVSAGLVERGVQRRPVVD